VRQIAAAEILHDKVPDPGFQWSVQLVNVNPCAYRHCLLYVVEGYLVEGLLTIVGNPYFDESLPGPWASAGGIGIVAVDSARLNMYAAAHPGNIRVRFLDSDLAWQGAGENGSTGNHSVLCSWLSHAS
jgi:hypothetical protein